MANSDEQDGKLGIGLYELEDEMWRATANDGRPRHMVYTVAKPIVVLGRGSKPEVELDVGACLRDEVSMLRRRGGGCSVVIDTGNVLVAASIAVKGIGENRAHFDRLNRWLIGGLASLGFHGVASDGISDLVIGARKVGGTCIYRAKGVLLYSASLLVQPEIALIERYLRYPPREPEYRRGRSHRDFLTSLSELLGDGTAQSFADRLRDVLDPPRLPNSI